LQREFARNIQDFDPRDESGKSLKWEKIDKGTWRVETGTSSNAPHAIAVHYRVYANELSVRTSHLDASHAYFNGASVFMYVKGALRNPVRLKVLSPPGWQVTTALGLAPDSEGYYHAPDYDILVDSPTEAGTHKLLQFEVRGKVHRVALWGEARIPSGRLETDLAKIVEQGALLFGGLPYDHYTFIVHVQGGIGGGLEHLNSTTLGVTPDAFASRTGYVGFLGLASHEYFHLWNVKRIRPEALGPFDYEHENYTRSLWLSEGVTDYYGQQLVRRANLITPAEYLKSLAAEISLYERTPGRLEQSAEQASYDSWIKYYRPDENSANSSISYYNKGELLGWMLDIEIRQRTNGRKSMDDVMRGLFQDYAQRGAGFPDADLKGVFEKVAGADLTDFFDRYVKGTSEIDFEHYLQAAGLHLDRTYEANQAEANIALPEPEQKATSRTASGTLGLTTRVSGDRVFVASVPAGTAASQGDISAGDEIVAIDGRRIDAGNQKRRLESLVPGQRVTLTFFRREKLMDVNLVAGLKPPDKYAIKTMKEASPAQRELYRAWIRADYPNKDGAKEE